MIESEKEEKPSRTCVLPIILKRGSSVQKKFSDFDTRAKNEDPAANENRIVVYRKGVEIDGKQYIVEISRSYM